MANTTLPQRPGAGDKTLLQIVPAIQDAITVIEAETAARVRVLRDAADVISSLPGNAPIPTDVLDRIYQAALAQYANHLVDDTPEPVTRLGNLQIFALGHFVLDDDGNFVDREDFAVQQISRKIEAIDWTQEPASKDERRLRRHVIDQVRKESKSVLGEANALRLLAPTGAPARDLAKAIKQAEDRYKRQCAEERARRDLHLHRDLALRLARGMA